MAQKLCQIFNMQITGGWDGIVDYSTSHEAYCLWVGSHSGHNFHTWGWGDMKMKGQPNRDSNPVPPSQRYNHVTDWSNEAGMQISVQIWSLPWLITCQLIAQMKFRNNVCYNCWETKELWACSRKLYFMPNDNISDSYKTIKSYNKVNFFSELLHLYL